MRFLVGLLLVSSAFAQSPLELCHPTARVQAALDEIPSRVPLDRLRQEFLDEQTPKLEALAGKHPDDFFVQRRLVRHLFQANRTSRSLRVAGPLPYQDRARQAPEDLVAQYLWAEALAGPYPYRARNLIEPTVDTMPSAAWIHFLLAELYTRSVLPDPDRAKRHALRFNSLCPGRVEGYGLLVNLELSPSEANRAADRLARLAARLRGAARFDALALLWPLRAAAEPTADPAPWLAPQVADVFSRQQVDEIAWYDALRIGYRLLGDADALNSNEREMRRRQAKTPEAKYQSAKGKWAREHTPPSGVAWALVQNYYRDLLVVTADWAQRWPLVDYVWRDRLQALAGIDDIDPAEASSIVDDALEAFNEARDTHYRPRIRALAARALLKHGQRLAEIEGLANARIREKLDDREMALLSSGQLNSATYRVIEGDLWRARVARAELGWRKEDAGLMRRAIESLVPMVPDAPQDTGFLPKEDYARKTTELALAQARLASLAGRSSAAVDYYRQAVAHRPIYTNLRYSTRGDIFLGEQVIEEFRRYWDSLRRDPALFEELLSEAQGEELEPASKRTASWAEGYRELPEFELADLEGRMWRSRDLLGRWAVVGQWPERYMDTGHVYEALSGALRAQGIPLLVFALGTSETPFRRETARRGWTFPVCSAPPALSIAMNPAGGPYLWVVRPDGQFQRRASFSPYQRDPVVLHRFAAEIIAVVEE